MFSQPALAAGFAMSALVTTVVMATLVVGPFHLSGALNLDAARVGLARSTGPLAAAFTGAPAGRAVDRFGAQPMTFTGLAVMAAGSAAMPIAAGAGGLPGYIAALVAITSGYALFQAANNTAVITSIEADQRGVGSGMLNLSRNLGLITGASVMGAVFARASGVRDVAAAHPQAVVAGVQATFAVATALVLAALALAILARRPH